MVSVADFGAVLSAGLLLERNEHGAYGWRSSRSGSVRPTGPCSTISLMCRELPVAIKELLINEIGKPSNPVSVVLNGPGLVSRETRRYMNKVHNRDRRIRPSEVLAMESSQLANVIGTELGASGPVETTFDAPGSVWPLCRCVDILREGLARTAFLVEVCAPEFDDQSAAVFVGRVDLDDGQIFEPRAHINKWSFCNEDGGCDRQLRDLFFPLEDDGRSEEETMDGPAYRAGSRRVTFAPCT